MRRTPTTPRKEHRPLRRRTRALESSLPPKSHGGAAGKRRKAAPISSALVWWARAHASTASMASTGGRGGIPPHSPNLRELAELVRSRHRGVGGGVGCRGGWRRQLSPPPRAVAKPKRPAHRRHRPAPIRLRSPGRPPSGRLGPSLARPAAVHSTRSASAHGTRGIGMELQVHIVAPLVQCSRPMGAACGRRTARDALCELLRRRRRCWWRRGDRRRAGLATICQRARNER